MASGRNTIGSGRLSYEHYHPAGQTETYKDAQLEASCSSFTMHGAQVTHDAAKTNTFLSARCHARTSTLLMLINTFTTFCKDLRDDLARTYRERHTEKKIVNHVKQIQVYQ